MTAPYRRLPHSVLVLALSSIGTVALSPPVASAQEWLGTASSDWFNAFNWSTGAVPITSDNVVISTTSPNGTVVDGATANVNEVEIATTADGAVTVRNGGRLATQRQLLIGQSKDHAGTATVSGAGSLLSSRFTLGVGYEGNGSLLVENGGRAQAESLGVSIGAAAGSKGSATVTGAGSTLFGHFGISVGAYGEGSLEILDGGLAAMTPAGNIDLQIGSQAGGKGRVLVSGLGSHIDASGVEIGEYGEGSLTIADGATLDVTRIYIGAREGGVGELNVKGEGSRIIDGNLFYIGNAGTGTFTVIDGARVDVAYTVIGTYEGGVGELLVSGEGTVYRGFGKVGSISTLGIGSAGDGSVTVSDGAAIISEHNVEVGAGIGSGKVLVTGVGSRFNITASDLRLGVDGYPEGPSRGEFTVEDGASGSVASGLYLGRDEAGTGTMTVTGTGSSFEVHGNLLAGQQGDGTLSVLDGGLVTARGLTSVGNLEGSTGRLEIDGTGSKLDARNFVFIGNLGDGEAAVTGGGSLDSAGSVSLGGYRDSTSAGTGAVTVAGEGSILRAAGWIDVGGSGVGSLAIADTAHVSAGYGVVIANREGSTGLLAIGAGRDASGRLLAAVAPGTLDTGDPANSGGGLLRLGDGNATLLFNHTGTSYDFDTVIAGSGLIQHAAGTTNFSADSSAFAGTTRITGGHLSIDGALGGVITVRGGTLGGNGTLGSVTLGNGGALAPGGIGTLNIAGDVTFDPGSMLDTEIAADGTSDLLAVGGTASLAGTLSVLGIAYPTGYPDTQSYTILTAGGGVTGTFEQVTDNLPDVDVTATYNANDVVIGYERTTDTTSPKEVYPNSLQAGLGAGRLFAGTLQQRGQLRGLVGPTPGGALPLSYGPAEGSLGLAGDSGTPYGVATWANVIGLSQDVDANGGVAGYDADTYGLASGVDSTFDLGGALGRAGVALGYTSTDVDVSASSADIDAWHLGVYGGVENGPFAVSGALSYAWQDYGFSRFVPLIGGGGTTASGEADGNLFAASLEASYDIAAPMGIRQDIGFRFAPIVSLDYVRADRDGFTESGAGVLDMTVDSDDISRTWLGAGIAMSARVVGQGGLVFTPELQLMYQHNVGDNRAFTSSVIAPASATFTTPGVLEDDDLFGVGAGLGIGFTEGASLTLRYEGSFGSNDQSHRGNLGLSIRF